jgi:transposase
MLLCAIMKLSYEELEAKLFRTEDLLKKVLDEIARLQTEIEKLKAQINRNSRNSSKPPSTDQKSNTNCGERIPRESREGKARDLFPSNRIDRHVQCTEENCPYCDQKTWV